MQPDPGHPEQGVAYRDGQDGSAHSGERGNIIISEVLWSGTVTNEGVWDKTDVFVELRNEGSRPVNLSGWVLMMEGGVDRTWTLRSHFRTRSRRARVYRREGQWLPHQPEHTPAGPHISNR